MASTGGDPSGFVDCAIPLQSEIVVDNNPSKSVNTKEQINSITAEKTSATTARGSTSLKSPKGAQEKASFLGKAGEQPYVYQPNVYAPQPQAVYSGGYMNPSGQWEEYPYYVSMEGLHSAPPFYDGNQSIMLSPGYANNPQGVKCQRRARVRVSAVATAPERVATAAKTTMYDVLSVGTSAGPEEIKAAYRRAALRWHPDTCPGGADRFMMARKAYEVLSDPERRRGYDIQLRFGGVCGGARSSHAAPGAGYADWEAQLAGLQWRAAEEARAETWGNRMRRRAAAQTSSSR